MNSQETPLIYDKPFKTYEEQIQIMESRNIIVHDHSFAKQVLSSLSYYTIINGYKNTFLSVPGTDNFSDGTSFENLYTLHIIDTNINAIILKYILFVEKYLKTRLAYCISSKYGVYTDFNDLTNMNSDDYLCRNYYSRSARGRNNILRRIKQTITLGHINSSVEHYISDKNHIPPWILVTNLTFGLSIKWYSILKSDDKIEICSQFIRDSNMPDSDKKEFLAVTFSLLREYRNRIAHSNRTFNTQGLPVLPKRQLLSLTNGFLSSREYDHNIGKSDLFAVILTFFILIDDRFILSNLIQDLSYVLRPYDENLINGKSIFEIFNLPNDIFFRMNNLLGFKFS